MEEHPPRVKVCVTAEEIEFAVPRDSSHCMIAEAVKSAYPDASFVSVDLQTIRFTDVAKKRRYTYLTPRRAQVALIDFDGGIKPEPFDFQLRNGQVTVAGRQYQRPKSPSEKSRAEKSRADESRAENARKGRMSQKLVTGTGGSNSSPDKIGGRTPPTTSFAKRRAFGLRALER